MVIYLVCFHFQCCKLGGKILCKIRQTWFVGQTPYEMSNIDQYLSCAMNGNPIACGEVTRTDMGQYCVTIHNWVWPPTLQYYCWPIFYWFRPGENNEITWPYPMAHSSAVCVQGRWNWGWEASCRKKKTSEKSWSRWREGSYLQRVHRFLIFHRKLACHSIAYVLFDTVITY